MSIQQNHTRQLERLRKRKDGLKEIYTAYQDLTIRANAISEMASKLGIDGLSQQEVHHGTNQISGVRDALFVRWGELCDEEVRLMSSGPT